MTEDSEFGKGFADDHDDWGMDVNPEKLNTLHCLNGHLSAEEDYRVSEKAPIHLRN